MYENIIDKIAEENWDDAEKELGQILADKPLDEKLAILSATIFHAKSDEMKAREQITEGLRFNYRNYELWLMLGETYQNSNINQAFLCYENALFYCNDADDQAVIGQYIENVKNSQDFGVQKTAIVILSYNSVNYTKQCIDSIVETCPESAYEIVIVDNNSKDGSIEYLKTLKNVKLQFNDYNAGFPAGCNQGIRLAEKTSDIFLLNNDTVLPPNALFWLRMGLYESARTGATGSVSNYVSNFQIVNWDCKNVNEYIERAKLNNLPMKHPYEYKNYLVGFAVLIKRHVFEEIGYLDEIFTPGTYEDNDLGLRICKAGYNVLLCRNSFIFHYGSGGGSNTNKWNNLYEKNAAKLSDKWGFEVGREFRYNRYIVDLLSAPQEAKMKVLEVGCGLGGTLLALKSKFPNSLFYGIENNKNLTDLIPYCIGVWKSGPETGNIDCPDSCFDVIIMDEVFAKSLDQPALLYKYSRYLKDNGIVVAGGIGITKQQILSAHEGNNDTAVCIYTHNHPESVAQVLATMCLGYYLHGMDLYYFDSSESEETEKIVRNWINKGYSNIKYVKCQGMLMLDKMAASLDETYFDKEYSYYWPTKDRSIWPGQTLDLICENKNKNTDYIYLEPRPINADESIKYDNACEVYHNHCLGLTSVDTTIYAFDTVRKHKGAFKEQFKKNPSFAHYCYILETLSEPDSNGLLALQGTRVKLYDTGSSASGWEKNAFQVWEDDWVRANESLPKIYDDSKEYVIKRVASVPWLVGGKARIKELIDHGALSQENIMEVEKNWTKVSDIPFSEVRTMFNETLNNK